MIYVYIRLLFPDLSSPSTLSVALDTTQIRRPSVSLLTVAILVSIHIYTSTPKIQNKHSDLRTSVWNTPMVSHKYMFSLALILPSVCLELNSRH